VKYKQKLVLLIFQVKSYFGNVNIRSWITLIFSARLVQQSSLSFNLL